VTNTPLQWESTDYSRFHYFKCYFHGIFRELGKCNDSFAALKLFYSIFIPFMKYLVYRFLLKNTIY